MGILFFYLEKRLILILMEKSQLKHSNFIILNMDSFFSLNYANKAFMVPSNISLFIKRCLTSLTRNMHRKREFVARTQFIHVARLKHFKSAIDLNS